MPTLGIETLLISGTFMLIGVSCIIAFLLSAGERTYLMYLGIVFLSIALPIMKDKQGQMVLHGWGHLGVLLILVFAVIMSLVEMARHMRLRVERLREEQRDREEAFAELQTALAQQAAEKEAAADVRE